MKKSNTLFRFFYLIVIEHPCFFKYKYKNKAYNLYNDIKVEYSSIAISSQKATNYTRQSDTTIEQYFIDAHIVIHFIWTTF